MRGTGVLFVDFNVDRRLLFLPLTEQTFAEAFQYYTTFYNAPMAVRVRPSRSRCAWLTREVAGAAALDDGRGRDRARGQALLV